MEDIIVSLEPAFHRVERFILWHNRYASLLAFFIGHCLFYAMARAGLRPVCAVVLVVLTFHILDCLKKKRVVAAGENNLCELTRLVLRSYRHVCSTSEALNTLKMENRVKYSLLMIIACVVLAAVGLRVNGFYLSYFTMLILFTLPAIVYHKLIPKLLKRMAPILEQLDQSMEYKRRSLIDRNELLVKINKPGSIEEEEDEVVRKLKEQQNREQSQSKTRRRSLTTSDDEEESEQRLINNNDASQTMVNFRQRYQNQNSASDAAVVPKPTIMDSSFDMLSDSSSSMADDETARISELYAKGGDRIDGKHRIKIKGDELKIKGRSTKQRPKIMDANFFQSNDDSSGDVTPPSPSLVNTAALGRTGEPDLTSFDFLNDYDDKA